MRLLLGETRFSQSRRLTDILRAVLRSLLSTMISQLTCPVCGKKVVLEQTTSMPFCSERCRQIDLGRWLEEEIGIPVESGEYQEREDASAKDASS